MKFQEISIFLKKISCSDFLIKKFFLDKKLEIFEKLQAGRIPFSSLKV
jgi:hypothetical protein